MVRLLVLFMLLSATSKVYGVVETSSEHYFKIKIDLVIDSPIKTVSQRLLDIGQWWNPSHSYSGDKNNLYFDLEKRMCFCEKIPGGGIVSHMQVANYQSPALMRLVGGLGPLQSLPVNGVLDFNLQSTTDKKTQLTVTYQVSGMVPGLQQWSKPVDGVITEQVTRFKKFAEQP